MRNAQRRIFLYSSSKHGDIATRKCGRVIILWDALRERSGESKVFSMMITQGMARHAIFVAMGLSETMVVRMKQGSFKSEMKVGDVRKQCSF